MEERRTVTNTAEEAKRDPTAMLLASLAIGSSAAILSQEAVGQTELVLSTQLPTDCRDRAPLEAAGVVFGEPIPSDTMFCHAQLPEGWQKVGTGHSMHSVLVDAKGHERATIFYKAAFYDRSAHMSPSRRLRCADDYTFGKDTAQVRAMVWSREYRDGKPVDCIVMLTEPTSCASPVTRYDALGRACAEAKAWLDSEYPEWQDYGAYWDADLPCVAEREVQP